MFTGSQIQHLRMTKQKDVISPKINAVCKVSQIKLLIQEMFPYSQIKYLTVAKDKL